MTAVYLKAAKRNSGHIGQRFQNSSNIGHTFNNASLWEKYNVCGLVKYFTKQLSNCRKLY